MRGQLHAGGERTIAPLALKTALADAIIIPVRWRVRDIVVALAREGVAVSAVVIGHGGRPIDLGRDPHPH